MASSEGCKSCIFEEFLDSCESTALQKLVPPSPHGTCLPATSEAHDARIKLELHTLLFGEDIGREEPDRIPKT
jgi:hypothetical protein